MDLEENSNYRLSKKCLSRNLGFLKKSCTSRRMGNNIAEFSLEFDVFSSMLEHIFLCLQLAQKGN